MDHDEQRKIDQELELDKRKDEWLGKLCDEFSRSADKFLPPNLLPEENCPQWILNVQREILQVLAPVAESLPSDSSLTPKKVGASLGHACAYSVLNMQCLSELIADKQKAQKEDDLKKLQPLFVSHYNWHQAMRGLAQYALGSCIDQKYEYMSEFLLAFADAFSCKPKSFKPGDTVTASFEIHIFMLMNWRTIESLRSMRQFRGMLIKTFGKNRAGSVKRVEKLCQRIGKKFPKGRPKKSEIIQTPA